MVLPYIHVQSATLRNPKWRPERERLTIVAELPRVPATTPLPCKNLEGQGVHSAPVKFSIVPAKNSSPILGHQIIEWQGVYILVRLVWFCVNGTPKCRIFNR